jgi:hypothetical protein
MGDLSVGETDIDRKWLVIRCEDAPHNLVRIGGTVTHPDKIKFHEGEVIYCGTRQEAVAMIAREYPQDSVHFAVREGGG